MCVVSMISDHYIGKWEDELSKIKVGFPTPQISREELDEFHKLLERAREYDKKHNEPDCEIQEKKDILKKLAEKLGVEINFP